METNNSNMCRADNRLIKASCRNFCSKAQNILKRVSGTRKRRKKMQERFKFRIWDKTDKKFMSGSIFIDCRSGCMSGNMPIDKYVIQQCTGIKDRNGKLIYEGDIVKYTDCEGKETIGCLAIDRFNLLTFVNMVNCDFCEEWADVVKAVFFTGNSTIEVIGNIYENKELLGEQK